MFHIFTRQSEINQYWGGGGGSRINLNCFRTFLVLLCVLLFQMEIIVWGGGGDQAVVLRGCG